MLVRTIKADFAMVSHNLNHKKKKKKLIKKSISMVRFKFFSLTERWGPLTHFSTINLLSIYDYILKKVG